MADAFLRIAARYHPASGSERAVHRSFAGELQNDCLGRECIVINGLSGEPGKPITFDGHGAWLTGADHLPSENWSPAKAGPEGTLVLNGIKLREPWWSTLCVEGKMRWGDSDPDALRPGEFFYLDGTKTLYYNSPADFKTSKIVVGLTDGTTVELLPEKWGYTNFKKIPTLRRNRDLKAAPATIKVNSKDAPLMNQPALQRLEPGHSYNDGKTFYYRPPNGKTIRDVRMMIITRSSGVALNGSNRHLVFKNLNAVYVGNDGYNIHGDTKDVTFLNCNAFFTGDEGFSSHDRCETILDGGIFLQCSNGIHNVNNCSAITRNVIVDHAGLRNNRQDTKSGIRPHEVSSAILIDCGLGTTQTKVDNVLLVNGGMSLGFDISLKRVTVTDGGRVLRVDAGSSVAAENCLFAEAKGIIHARMADPAAAFSFKNIWFDSKTNMEWGVKYPWKPKPFAGWLKAHPKIAINGTPVELSLGAALNSGFIPEAIVPGMGCSRELLQRYIDFRGKRQEMLDKALEMAWKE
jgi:hypothetical protein